LVEQSISGRGKGLTAGSSLVLLEEAYNAGRPAGGSFRWGRTGMGARSTSGVLERITAILHNLLRDARRNAAMDIDEPSELPDLTLAKIGKQDLYTMSVGDLEERMASLKAEIARCEAALTARGSTRAAAEKLFKL
jgi:uncharacterized small protein (DUF1192 family)